MTVIPHPDELANQTAVKAITRGGRQAADDQAMEAMWQALEQGRSKEEANEIFSQTYIRALGKTLKIIAMIKETILNNLQKENPSSIPVFKAMDELALRFGKWICKCNYAPATEDNYWVNQLPGENDIITTEQLYKLFLESQVKVSNDLVKNENSN